VTDQECVEFLQWALPRMQMRWSGFRKVRRQVCRRIQRRMQVLEKDVQGYREFLEAEPEEWDVLDALCRITISRFYRDRAVFAYLQTTVLPALAEAWQPMRVKR
jgi:chemotaxis protein methyltransferase CheR